MKQRFLRGVRQLRLVMLGSSLVMVGFCAGRWTHGDLAVELATAAYLGNAVLWAWFLWRDHRRDDADLRAGLRDSARSFRGEPYQ